MILGYLISGVSTPAGPLRISVDLFQLPVLKVFFNKEICSLSVPHRYCNIESPTTMNSSGYLKWALATRAIE